MAGSGILEVEDGGGKTVYCFFLARWSLKWNIEQNQLEFSLATTIFSKSLCSSLPMLALVSVSFKGSYGTIWELVTRCLSTQGSSLQALRWSSHPTLFVFTNPSPRCPIWPPAFGCLARPLQGTLLWKRCSPQHHHRCLRNTSVFPRTSQLNSPPLAPAGDRKGRLKEVRCWSLAARLKLAGQKVKQVLFLGKEQDRAQNWQRLTW